MPCENCQCLFRGLDGSAASPAADPPPPCLVSGAVQCVRFEKGEMLFLKGEPGQSLYTITSGVVKICDHSTDGREQIVGLGRPGSLLVGLQSLSEENYAYSAEAATAVRACRVNHKSLLGRIGDRPELAVRLIEALNAQLMQSRALIQAIGHKGAAAKVASFLLLMTPAGKRNGDIRLPMSRLEIGNLLGLSEETVCRLMAEMKRGGVIRAPRGRIEVRDWKRLEAIADGVH